MSNGMAFEFLDVGMGDSTLVEFPPWDGGPLWLVDFGERGSPFKVAARDATKFLVKRISATSRTRGLTYPYLDVLCITHADGDHWNKVGWLIDGKTDVRSNMWKEEAHWADGTKLKIGTLVFGGSWVRDYEARDKTLADQIWDNVDEVWEIGNRDFDKPTQLGYVEPRWRVNKGNSELEAQVYLLSSNLPSKTAKGDCNPKSLVMMFRYKNNKMILTGDAGWKEVEPTIIKRYSDAIGLFPAWGLKLGHHGSKASSGYPFLEVVEPQAVFASGDRRWGHPYCDPITRAKSVGKLGTTLNHWYSCSKTGGDSDYTSDKTTLQICTNLWYVVTTKPGITRPGPDGNQIYEPWGTYTGAQWRIQFEADNTIYFNVTGQWPAP